MAFNFIRRPFVMLLTVPAVIAIVIGALPFLLVPLERWLFSEGLLPYSQIDVETARTLLTAIAAGAMTALSLTYSLVLVVFTLAAGNIGPRLLKRFTSDLVNQITAGIFGGAFLFCLGALLYVSPDRVQQLPLVGACLLALACVLQLIFFVRHVSKSVTIDDEVAEISNRLKQELHDHFDQSDEDEEEIEWEGDEKDGVYASPVSGYVGSIDTDRITEIAKENNSVFRIEKPGGAFVIEGEPFMVSNKKIDEQLAETLGDCLLIEKSRSENTPVEFSTNLLIEIALRALSPGVNDTYTALAVVDSLSNAFSEIASEKTSPGLRKDEEGDVRLIVPSISLKNLFGKTFHPLRRAASDNILMAQGLAKAYSRIWIVGTDEIKDAIQKHAELLIKELKQMKHFNEDIESVEEFFVEGLVKK